MLKKIAIFGINNDILSAIRGELNPSKVDLVAFFDNNDLLHGIYLDDIEIYPPEKVCEIDFDYILIAALSAYDPIREQLTKLGIAQSKIQPFIPIDIFSYVVSGIKSMSESLIREIYLEPDVILERTRMYQIEYDSYMAMHPFEEIPDAWYNSSHFISHACGGKIGKREIMFTNSKEALQYSINKGFRLIECDVIKTSDDEYLLAHKKIDLWRSQKEGYTVINVKEILCVVRDNPFTTLLIDYKWNDHNEYKESVERINQIIKEISRDEHVAKCLKKRVILEVYDEDTIQSAYNGGFQMAFTQYRNDAITHYMNTANICGKYGINVVLLSAGNANHSERKFMKILTDKNIKLFAFSTNSVTHYAKLRSVGFTGVFTDYLSEAY